jgi:hypothetical protein
LGKVMHCKNCGMVEFLAYLNPQHPEESSIYVCSINAKYDTVFCSDKCWLSAVELDPDLYKDGKEEVGYFEVAEVRTQQLIPQILEFMFRNDISFETVRSFVETFVGYDKQDLRRTIKVLQDMKEEK